MIAQVLIDIEGVDLFGVKPGQEHVDDKQDVDPVLIVKAFLVARLNSPARTNITSFEYRNLIFRGCC